MYKTITFSTFCDSFRDMDRNYQFTYEGKRHLFDYFENYEEESDEMLELDVIAICCEYSEEPLSDVLTNYRLEDLDELENNTQVINFDPKTGLVLYLQY